MVKYGIVCMRSKPDFLHLPLLGCMDNFVVLDRIINQM